MRKSVFSEKFKVSSKQENQIKNELKAFYLDVRGEEIGIIEEQQMFDFFYEHMVPIIYNKALDNAQCWHRQQIENFESDYYSLYCDIR